jgi:hypothetical protein
MKAFDLFIIYRIFREHINKIIYVYINFILNYILYIQKSVILN